jgi:hypothetical protein
MNRIVEWISVALLFASPSFVLAAETTDLGKIVVTQGHSNPSCRIVLFKSNTTGAERAFRIPNIAGTDINAVALAAVVSQLDVTITFEPTQTTGCGTEPAVQYISIVSR